MCNSAFGVHCDWNGKAGWSYGKHAKTSPITWAALAHMPRDGGGEKQSSVSPTGCPSLLCLHSAESYPM